MGECQFSWDIDLSPCSQATSKPQILIEGWRIDYDEQRPHGSLGNLTSSKFAENWAENAVSAVQNFRRPLAQFLGREHRKQFNDSSSTVFVRSAQDLGLVT